MPKTPEQPYNFEQAREEASRLQEKVKSGEAQTYAEAEQLVDDAVQAKSESKEKDKRPLFVAYRENDLFNKIVPFIVSFLEERGHQINVHSFPAGTDVNTWKFYDWLKDHSAEYKSRDIVADTTLVGFLSFSPKINLDTLVNQATAEVILGDATFAEELQNELREDPSNLEKKQQYLSVLGEMYKKILSSIPEEKRRQLEMVILTGVFEGHPTLIAHEQFCPRNNFSELIRETNAFADKMKGWFEEAGISKVTVCATGAEIPPETILRLKGGSAYIVFDRHTFTPKKKLTYGGEFIRGRFWGKNYEDAKLIEEKAALQTPIETFYDDIVSKVGIDVDPQKVKEVIKRKLQEQEAVD